MNMQVNAFSNEQDWAYEVQSAGELFGLPEITNGKVKVFKNEDYIQKTTKSYSFDKKRLKAVLTFLFAENLGDGLMLYGPFGCGKTSFIREVLGRLCWPTLMLSWNETSDTADLIGKTGISFGDTTFEPGPLTIAAKMGYALVVNEVDRGRAGNLVALNDLLDGGKLVIKETGEVITPHPNFRLICTANSAGSGDLTGAYTGSVRKLDPAFLDRFAMLEVGYMDLESEMDLILKQFPEYLDASGKFVELMCKFAAETRAKAQDVGEILSTPLSTRSLVRFFHYGRSMNIVSKIKGNARDLPEIISVLEFCYLNRLSPEEQEVVRVALNMNFGAKSQ